MGRALQEEDSCFIYLHAWGHFTSVPTKPAAGQFHIKCENQHQWHQLTSCPPVGEEKSTHSLKASEHPLFVWNNHPNISRKVLGHSTPLQPVFNIKLLCKMIPNVTAHSSAHPYFMFSPSLVVGYSIQCTTGLLWYCKAAALTLSLCLHAQASLLSIQYFRALPIFLSTLNSSK